MWWLALVLACGEDSSSKGETADTAAAPAPAPEGDTGDAPEPEPEPCEPSTWYQDADGDGYGDPFVEVSACEAPEGMVDNHADCDDLDPTEYPGAIWYRDLDGDGTGDPEQSLTSCAQPIGYIGDDTDCDDTDSARYPGAVWYVDADEDGHGDASQELDGCGDVEGAVPDAGDCNDEDWFIHPEANEACDEVDNDCDELVDDDDPDIDIFTQVLMYEDLDGDGWGVEEELLGHLCSNYPGASDQFGDCDDADPAIYPQRLDYLDEIDSDCDGEASVFYAASSLSGWNGSTTSSGFGIVVDSKDLDGDGRNEVIVGAYNEGDYVGSIKFIPGELSGDRSGFPEEGRMWDGEQEDDRVGYSVDFAGDWDGDGVEDLIVASPYRDEYTGLAYIVSTEMESTSLADATHFLQNDVAESYFGHDVQGVGDINGDGLDDVLISARKDSRMGNSGGSIVVAYGGDTDMDTLPEAQTIFSETNWDQLGYALSEAGDPDGDGVADFLVGAPYCDDGETNAGCAYLFSSDELESEAVAIEEVTRFWGVQTNEYAGLTLASAGDFDGDGLDDLLIGAPNHDVAAEDEGAAYVVLGSTEGWESTSLADAHLLMLGNNDGDKAAKHLNGVGDINGDGSDDIVVASAIADALGDYAVDNMGVVFGVLGGTESGVIELATESDFVVLGIDENDYLGKGIAPAGDVDEDGMDDFWLGANGATSYGTIYLISGVAAP